MSDLSPAQWLASDPELLQRELASLSVEARADLLWKWEGWWARTGQVEPVGDWGTWLILAGRGFGKTRTGAEWVRKKVKQGYGRIALVAETAADARDVMVEGPSGILAITPKHERPIYESSKRRLTWPNGATATTYNGTEPDQLRGPEHAAGWIDEIAKYAYPQETWDNLQFGLRVGDSPKVCVTTTPRPIPIVRALILGHDTIITRGSTFDNAANLPLKFIATVKERYEGTRLGRQELFAEVLSDVPGALWVAKDILRAPSLPPMQRIVVGVDPSGADGDPEKGRDSIGIVVAGLGIDGKYYILEDATCDMGPAGWGRRVVERYDYWSADRVVAEGNFGGAMVEAVIRTASQTASFKLVTASRGKAIRAEPISALYEQQKVMHASHMPELEHQMLHTTTTGYIGDGSPDRMDAMVWAMTELSGGRSAPMFVPDNKQDQSSYWRP